MEISYPEIMYTDLIGTAHKTFFGPNAVKHLFDRNALEVDVCLISEIGGTTKPTDEDNIFNP